MQQAAPVDLSRRLPPQPHGWIGCAGARESFTAEANE